MKGLYLDGSTVTLRRDLPEVAPREGEVVLRVRAVGVCDTDLQLARGYMGFRGVIGHEFVGDDARGDRWVAEINNACRRCPTCLAGRPTHCPARTVLGIVAHDGAMAERVAVPRDNLHPVPDAVSDEEAVFVEPLAAAFQVLEQVRVAPDDRVAVLGDGKLGLLSAWVLRTATPRVTLVGRHAHKLALAGPTVAQRLAGDVADLARAFDVVVDATGSASGLASALGLCRPRGTVVLKTTVAAEHALSLAPVVIDELTLVGSRCGPFPKALDALARKAIDVRPLLAARYPPRRGRGRLRLRRAEGRGEGDPRRGVDPSGPGGGLAQRRGRGDRVEAEDGAAVAEGHAHRAPRGRAGDEGQRVQVAPRARGHLAEGGAAVARHQQHAALARHPERAVGRAGDAVEVVGHGAAGEAPAGDPLRRELRPQEHPLGAAEERVALGVDVHRRDVHRVEAGEIVRLGAPGEAPVVGAEEPRAHRDAPRVEVVGDEPRPPRVAEVQPEGRRAGDGRGRPGAAPVAGGEHRLARAHEEAPRAVGEMHLRVHRARVEPARAVAGHQHLPEGAAVGGAPEDAGVVLALRAAGPHVALVEGAHGEEMVRVGVARVLPRELAEAARAVARHHETARRARAAEGEPERRAGRDARVGDERTRGERPRAACGGNHRRGGRVFLKPRPTERKLLSTRRFFRAPWVEERVASGRPPAALDVGSRWHHAPTSKGSSDSPHAMSFKINDRCTGCSACAPVCPTGAIRGEHRGMHVIDPVRCIDCGACGVTCPDEAVLDHHGSVFSLCEAPARAYAWVDLAACTGCGWCSEVCPWDAVAPALVRAADGTLRVAAVHAERCVSCGACELECDRGAIAVLLPRDPRVAVWRARNERFLAAATPAPPSPCPP